jgi:dihydrolipoamide dehydrogenase
MTEIYDVVVIGARPVGGNVVERVIKAGLSAVVIKSGLIEGECSC